MSKGNSSQSITGASPPAPPQPGPLHSSVCGKRAPRAIQALRAHQLAGWIIEGGSRPTLLKRCQEEWGVGLAVYDQLRARATKIITAQIEQERPDALAEKLAILETIAEKAMAAGQYAAAVGALSVWGKWIGFGQSWGLAPPGGKHR